ncbi:MAG TPA: glycosyltransferase family 4 protein [Anaerolineae bacterium]|nr:glycosyltransferase family 4 protein [Anaerolineae bacterium]
MNLLFLLTQSLDYPSGVGRYWPLARELARLGHHVEVAALHPDLGSVAERVAERDGVRVCYAGPMHVRQVDSERHYYGTAGLGWAVLRGTAGLALRALASRADMLHVCKPHPMNGLAGVLARTLRGCRFYLDCDDYEAESNRYASGSGGWQKRVVAAWEDRLPALARGITTNTHFMAQRLSAAGYDADRIVYVPNGIDRRRFADLDPARTAALRARLGLGDSQVVVYVGSLSSTSHPVDLLLDACAQLFRARSNVRLLLVGGGEDYTAVGRQVAEKGLAGRVILTGRVPADEVPYYYLLGDVSVDPVHDDLTARARSPLKLFESMALGIPLVTGDAGDRREHLGNGQAGVLVAPGSARALADGLLAVLDDPVLRHSMGECGRALAERYYWDVQVHEFARVYDL